MKTSTLTTMFLLVATSSLGLAQHRDDLKPAAKPVATINKPTPATAKDLGLAEIEMSFNKWGGYVPPEEVIARFGWLINNNGVDLGPNTQELLREVGDGALRTSPEVQGWMQHSQRQEQGRVADTYWRFQLTTGGDDSSSSTRVGLGSVSASADTAWSRATLSVRAIFLPTQQSHVFRFEATHRSTKLTSIDNSTLGRLFRGSGLAFSFDQWQDQPQAVQTGYVAVARLWLAVDKGLPELTQWMESVSQGKLKQQSLHPARVRA